MTNLDDIPDPAKASRHELVIAPSSADKHYWHDLWAYRELFQVLARRDISVRYKQTVIGAAWALVRPILTMIVFTVIFGRIAKLPSEGDAPYALMVFAGMLPWSFFSTAVTDASNSLLANSNLISKVYFPRMIVPFASVMVALVDFAIALVVFAGLMIAYRYPLTLNVLLLPIFIALAFALSLGIGLFISALNVRYRDFRHIVPFLVQLGLFVSPVGFSSSVIPEQWRLLYALNPLVGIIDGFRWALLGGAPLQLPALALSAAVTGALILWGISKFRKTEKRFADIV